MFILCVCVGVLYHENLKSVPVTILFVKGFWYKYDGGVRAEF